MATQPLVSAAEREAVANITLNLNPPEFDPAEAADLVYSRLKNSGALLERSDFRALVQQVQRANGGGNG